MRTCSTAGSSPTPWSTKTPPRWRSRRRSFFEDLTRRFFVGEAGPDRVVPNGWAGLKMAATCAARCRRLLAARLPEAFAGQALESVPDAVIIRTALEAYLSSLEKVSTEDAAHAARGAKLPREGTTSTSWSPGRASSPARRTRSSSIRGLRSDRLQRQNLSTACGAVHLLRCAALLRFGACA